MAIGEIDRFMFALGQLESGNNYSRIGPRDPKMGRALGRYQIMESNWAPWAKEAGIKNPDWRNPAHQDQVAKHKMTQYFQKYGSWDLVAVAWFAGPGRAEQAKRHGVTSVGDLKDSLGTSVSSYVTKVMTTMGDGGPSRPVGGHPGGADADPQTAGGQGLSAEEWRVLADLKAKGVDLTGVSSGAGGTASMVPRLGGTGMGGTPGGGDVSVDPDIPDPTPRAAGGDLLGIAGGGELWKVDGTWFVVYDIPGTKPPVHMGWNVESTEAMERLTGNNLEPTPDRQVSSEEFAEMGVLNMGITAEIANTDEHPFAALVSNFERITLTQPWMRDPEVLGLTMGALIEGRDLSDAELKSTEWWRSRTDSERAWVELVAGDPKTARRQMLDGKRSVQGMLQQAGIDDPDSHLVNFLTQAFVTGRWTENKLQAQINTIGDPFSVFEMDGALSALIADKELKVDTTRDQEAEVRDLVTQWLGPVHGEWDDAKIARWAGRVRNDPDALDELTEMLRGQRLALFPEYENERLTYDDIAGPWRGLVQQQWGQSVDEKDPFFTNLVRANDAGVAQQLLRQEGLKRGVKQVTDEATEAAGAAFGGGVRRAV